MTRWHVPRGRGVGTLAGHLGTWLSAAAALAPRATGGPPARLPRAELVIIDHPLRVDLRAWFDPHPTGQRKLAAATDGFHLTLLNVGTGTAANVTARWRFPVVEFAATVEDLARESGTPLRLDWSDDAVLQLDVSGELVSLSNWAAEATAELGELAPASGGTVERRLAIPFAVRDLWLAYLHCALRSGFGRAHPADLPTAGLSIRYSHAVASAGAGDVVAACDYRVVLEPTTLEPGRMAGRLRARPAPADPADG